MLDWLSDPSNTEPPSNSDTTFIPDAPETPAPVFAYRALRSILFGSPNDESVVYENKENFEPPPVPIPIRNSGTGTVSRHGQIPPLMTSSSSTKHTATTKTQRTKARDSPVASPTRSKQLRSLQQSPAKSILRTPGVPTPRRRGIVNVSFKDVRPSISPALLPKKIEGQGRPLEEPDAGPARLTSEKVNATNTVSKHKYEMLDLANLEQKEQLKHLDASVLDTYIAKTERETRRLVRYNQKLKSYSRRRDEENGELRRENERLKRELEGFSQAALVKKTDQDQSQELRVMNQWARAPDCGRETVPRRGSTMSSRNRKDASVREDSANVTATPRTLAKEPEVSAVPETQRVASKARLPPDRLAAAKERLRVKSAERRRALSEMR